MTRKIVVRIKIYIPWLAVMFYPFGRTVDYQIELNAGQSVTDEKIASIAISRAKEYNKHLVPMFSRYKIVDIKETHIDG